MEGERGEREGKKMFPEDKKHNSLFYFPLSTSIMKSYPPGTASNISSPTSTVQSLLSALSAVIHSQTRQELHRPD